MFSIDPLLTELWIMALAGIVNGTADVEPERHVHADVAAEIERRWRPRDRPRA